MRNAYTFVSVHKDLIGSGAVLGTGDTGDCPLATSFSYQPSNTNISCTIANTEIVALSPIQTTIAIVER